MSPKVPATVEAGSQGLPSLVSALSPVSSRGLPSRYKQNLQKDYALVKISVSLMKIGVHLLKVVMF